MRKHEHTTFTKMPLKQVFNNTHCVQIENQKNIDMNENKLKKTVSVIKKKNIYYLTDNKDKLKKTEK